MGKSEVEDIAPSPTIRGDGLSLRTPLPQILTVADVAREVQSSQWFIRAEVRRGNLHARRFGRLIRFTTDDVREWLEAAW